MSESEYSDAALAKQAALHDKARRGEPVWISDLWGIWEPRVHPTDAERCRHCGGDARPEWGGDGLHCGLHVARGYDLDCECAS